jgi:predicted outer membrane protein
MVAALAGTVVALLVPLWSYVDRPAAPTDLHAARTVATQHGALSELDRGFVTRVRLAGLWEVPAGQQAEEKGTTEAVRTAGRHLVEGHTFLDRRVRDVAGKLGLPLPEAPTAQQKQWLGTLDAARGEDYDRKFAGIPRLADGQIYALAAEVRASTRNSLVRDLADDVSTTVLDHLEALEATGFVDFDALARDLAASGSPASGTGSPGTGTGPVTPGSDPGEAVPVSPSASPGSPTYSLPPAESSPPPSRQ